MENCHKKPSVVPLYPSWPAHSNVNRYRQPERVCPLGGEGDGEVQRGYRSTPWFHSSFSGLSHAGLSVLSHYISSARYPHSRGRLFLHTASLPTLNIFIILLCVADELLWLGFHYWAECRRPDGERKEEKEIRVSNSVRKANSRRKTNGGKTERGSNQYTSLLIKQAW